MLLQNCETIIKQDATSNNNNNNNNTDLLQHLYIVALHLHS